MFGYLLCVGEVLEEMDCDCVKSRGEVVFPQKCCCQCCWIGFGGGG